MRQSLAVRSQFIMSVVLSAALEASVGHAAPRKPPVLAMVEEAEKILLRAQSYTSVFHKVERVRGKLLPEEVMFLKFRKPFSIYMKWTGKHGRANELMYVEGWNKGRLRIRPRGLAGLFVFDFRPDSSMILDTNRHPITHIGLGYLTGLVADNMRRAHKAGELVIEDQGTGTLYGRPAHTWVVHFPADEPKGYYCYRGILTMDTAARIPLRLLLFDWKDELMEDYGYEDTRLDARLVDRDFDPANPEYRLK